jgi:hypothetical protein
MRCQESCQTAALTLSNYKEAHRIQEKALAAMPTSYVRYVEYGKASDEDIVESTGYTIDESVLALPSPQEEETDGRKTQQSHASG